MTHYGRYTRLTVIDTQGLEWIAATTEPLLPRPPVVSRAASPAFQNAMALQARDLYVSPPRLGTSGDSEAFVTTVIDIATPIFDEHEQRLGVLLFTLDWSLIIASLPHAREAHQGNALLVDAQGRWLLPDSDSDSNSNSNSNSHREGEWFGRPLSEHQPLIWAAMSARNQGTAILDEHLLSFRSHDLRTHHYRSQAGMIVSEANTQPWRLGILLPHPSVRGLLQESPLQLLAIALVYLLSVAFGVLWVLSNHRLRTLRQRALLFSHEARQYAREVQGLYEYAPCGYHSLDSRGRVVKINSTELKWLGYRADEVIGKRYYRDLVTPATRDAFDATFQQVTMGREAAAECELICRDGRHLPVAIQAAAHLTEAGFQYSRATVFDLSERKKLEDRLAKQALTDPLTGLGNRRYLENQAAMEIARAERSRAPLALIVIDLDHFKRINDTYGHDVGDRVLQAFAATAQNLLRDGDVLCRMGGEEFAVLLPNTTREQAIHVAERLRVAIANTPTNIADPSAANEAFIAYSASLGVTLVSAGETSLQPAFIRADQGLYAAKEAGRNRVHWHMPIA